MRPAPGSLRPWHGRYRLEAQVCEQASACEAQRLGASLARSLVVCTGSTRALVPAETGSRFPLLHWRVLASTWDLAGVRWQEGKVGSAGLWGRP